MSLNADPAWHTHTSPITSWTSAWTTASDGLIYTLVYESAVVYSSSPGASNGVAVDTEIIVINTIYGTASSTLRTAASSTDPAFPTLPSQSTEIITNAAGQPSRIQTVTAAPSPTGSSDAPASDLSTGAKAGISVGSAIGAILIFGLAITAYRLYRRDRTHRLASSLEDLDREDAVLGEKGFALDRTTPELDSRVAYKPLAELGGRSLPVELGSTARYEIGQGR